MSVPFQVGPETVVTLRHRAFDGDGEPIEVPELEAELVVPFGAGELLPAVERAIEGARPGDVRVVALQPEDAFGERDPEAILEVDAEEFPPETAPGDTFEAEGEDGELMLLTVLDVQEGVVVIDTNHPLAGQELRVEVEIVDVRPMSSEERDELEAQLLALTDPVPDVDPARLLGRRPVSYERGDRPRGPHRA